jgi:Aspartyl protease
MAPRDERYGDKFLEGPQHAAILRALFPQAVFLPQERSVHAPVNLRSLQLISEVDALIDSGATDNFISPAVVHQFNLPSRKLSTPRTIRNVDGSKNSIGEV